MKKRLAMVFFLIFLTNGAWSQIPRDGSHQNRPTQSKQDNTKTVEPSPSAIQIKAGSTKQEQKSDSMPSGYQWRELLAPSNIPGWLLVGVGFWAGLMALHTLRTIKRQANLMEATVQQIERQVIAQMDATNPIIIAIPENKVRYPRMFSFYWNPVNIGQTAGFIIETNTQFEAFASLDDIPKIPVYRKPFEWSQKPILPGKEGDGDGIGLITKTEMAVGKISKRVENREIRLFAYGRIKYRDIYQRNHETRFGFVWFPEVTRFEVGGPEQYNQYT
jgi:hypothetical protein